MNKTELIDTLHKSIDAQAGQPPVSKTTIERVLNNLGGTVQAELFEGGEVTLPGIGKFTVTQRAARTGRNPATGAEIQIPAKRAPAFTAAKALKDAVNN